MKQQLITDRIYHIRGQRVLLDEDLAELYGVPTKVLNQAVPRNMKRFPRDFMFQLHRLNAQLVKARLTGPREILRSQIVTLRLAHGAHRKYMPYVFTEQGVAMLASVLRSPKAIQVNIAIMRAFVQLRHALMEGKEIAAKVERLEGKVNLHDTDIRLLQDDVRKLEPKPDHPLPRVRGFESSV